MKIDVFYKKKLVKLLNCQLSTLPNWLELKREGAETKMKALPGIEPGSPVYRTH